MTPAKDAPLPSTLPYLIGVVGSVLAQRFADRVAPLGMKPKHIGLLTALASGEAASQLEVAETLRVVPSLVVRLADHLESAGAIERTRDPLDRRRQTLRLTPHGRALLAECSVMAGEMEAEYLAGVRAADKAVLRNALRTVAGNLGLP